MRTGIAALLLLTFDPQVALAKKDATDAEVSRLAKLSHEQYQKGDYQAAAESLLKAYELKPVAALLFNVAKTFEKAGNVEQAMRFYQRYIDAEDTDPKLVKQASRALDGLRTQQDERKRKEREAAEKKAADDKAAADKLAADKAAADQAEKDRLEKERQAQAAANANGQTDVPTSGVTAHPKRSRVLPYTLIGVGAVGLGAGAVLGLAAKSKADDEKKSTNPIQKPELRSDAKQRALFADVAYGVGAVAATVGIILIATEPKEPASTAVMAPSRLRPEALVFERGAGVAIGGSL